MVTNRELGDEWESICLDQIEPYVIDLRRTVNSGATFGDQDAYCAEFRISAKTRDKRGLTRKEVAEPYDKEPVGVFRVPLTILRVVSLLPNEPVSDFAYVDGTIVRLYGKDLFRLVAQDCFDRFEMMAAPPDEGLTPTLLREIKTDNLMCVFGLPDNHIGWLCRYKNFLDLTSTLCNLSSEQKKEPTEEVEEEAL